MTSELGAFHKYAENSAKMQAEAKGDPAKIEQVAVNLTANGYHRAALTLMDSVLKQRNAESTYLNSAIVRQRNGLPDMAVKSLTDGLSVYPQSTHLKELLIETALGSHDSTLIGIAERAIPESRYLKLRRTIAVRDDSATLASIVSGDGSATETMRCLDLVRLTRPRSLELMPIKDLLDRHASAVEPEWLHLLERFYGGDCASIEQAAIEAITGSELFKQVKQVFKSVTPRSRMEGFRLAQLIYPIRLTLVFEPCNDCLVKAVWAADPHYLRLVANEHASIIRLSSVPRVPKYFMHVQCKRSYVVAMSKLPGLPLILKGGASQAAYRSLEEIVRAMNEVGVVHNDLSPWNVVIDGDDSYVIDFGEARLDAPDLASDAAALARLKGHFAD